VATKGIYGAIGFRNPDAGAKAELGSADLGGDGTNDPALDAGGGRVVAEIELHAAARRHAGGAVRGLV
jgi:hypothetical protein